MQKTPKIVILDRKDVFPDDAELKRALGAMYSAYQEILKLTEGYSHEWKYYGKKYGWQLKVIRKGKALLYLTPHEGSFLIGCAVRDNERDLLLNSRLPKKVKQELSAAKKYAEGYPLRLSVKTESDMKSVRLVIGVLQSARP